MFTGTPPGTRRKSRFGALVSLLLAVVIGSGWWFVATRDGDAAPAADSSKDAPGPLDLTPEEVAGVARHVLIRRLPISGSLAPLLQTVIKAKVPGEVLAVNVREGMSVRQGEELMRLDTRSLAARVSSERAATEKARADLEIARLNHENAVRLFQKKVLAQNELDTKRSIFEATKAALKLAEAQLTVAEIMLDDASVRAPFDGVVAHRFVDPGGKVSPDSPLFELVDLAHMELQAAAPASEIPDVQAGQLAKVRVDGYGERSFEARVERINPTAEQGSRLILLYLSVDNSDGALRGGMFAQGDLLIEQTAPLLAIPQGAIVSESGVDYVMAIENGKATRKRVTLGMRSANDNLVELREGLAEGTRIIAVNLPSLEPGTPINLLAAKPEQKTDKTER
jgi:membrane fusion protein (multidrug efflux system)